MKKKESEIFHQALGDATHKPTINWEKEIEKAEKTKTQRPNKEELIKNIVMQSEDFNFIWNIRSLQKTTIGNLQNILSLLLKY
ncbi:MAG: hypothetical protein MK217_00390 [Gammaproteobacteria bacterium]|nr:hypothetical protein [Gammaproteobacteria bacterium]MCH2472707.1 hypothetical protein [Gammaproteobacteria bacterium]|tara:strand:+ start:130 stop:378 length:249 start_codon:yes stop_codon:yes gene_type:complete